MTEANTTRFDAEAAAWDNNPDVISASNSALTALLERKLIDKQADGST